MKHFITPEREMYHKLLAEFAASLPDGALVYDIGRTHAHEYREWFPRQRYMSIDRNPKAEPDILADVESDIISYELLNSAGALVCNGVTESATDPFALVRGCNEVVNGNKPALFGIRLTGYPLSENHDLTRFTFAGAANLLRQGRFTIVRAVPVFREGTADPTYGFFFCNASY